MDTTPDLTVFGRQLATCLVVHNSDTAQLADRTAIEKQRLEDLLQNATDLRYYELAAIADAFRIEPALLVSDVELPYDTYRVVNASDHTMIKRDFVRHLHTSFRQPGTPQKKYTGRFSLRPSDKTSAFTSDSYRKIMSTLSACWMLQELWEEQQFSGCKFNLFLDVPDDLPPEERGVEAARQLREKLYLPHDKPVTHIQQYARRIGVHVFRQSFCPVAQQNEVPFYGVCLSGKIGNNENGRIIIFDSSLVYFEEQFCVAHELAHALLGDPSVWRSRPTLREYGRAHGKTDQEKDERMANAFAWELLLPRGLPPSSNDFRKVIDDIVELYRPGGEVFNNPAKFASELLRDKEISSLIDLHEGLRDTLQRTARHEHRYSPTLRGMFERLHEEGYSPFDIDCLKSLIDKGMSHHFVEVCEQAYKDDVSKKEEIIGRCAEVFTVSPLRIEQTFEMYGHHAPGVLVACCS